MLNPSEEKVSSGVQSQPRNKQFDSILTASENDKRAIAALPYSQSPRNLWIGQNNENLLTFCNLVQQATARFRCYSTGGKAEETRGGLGVRASDG
jgi:hypothetical protein